MNPKNSGPNCILGRELKVLLRQSFNSLFSSLLHHATFFHDSIFFFFILFCSDKVSFVTIDLSLAL